MESVLNISRTLMVCVLLGLGSYWFNRDASKLVLEPLERMIERIRIVSRKPMALISEDEISKEGGVLNKVNAEKKMTKA